MQERRHQTRKIEANIQPLRKNGACKWLGYCKRNHTLLTVVVYLVLRIAWIDIVVVVIVIVVVINVGIGVGVAGRSGASCCPCDACHGALQGSKFG